MDTKKLIGIFSHEEEAIEAIKNLKDVGYEDDEISVIAKQEESVEKVKEVTDIDVNAKDDYDKAADGAAIGGVLGGAGGILAGLGVFTIPGIGPLLAAGPIVTTLGGLAAGGAVGGLAGALADIGIDKQEAEEFEKYLERGDILVAVDEKPNLNSEEVYRGYYDNNSIIRKSYNLRYGMH